MNMRLFGSILLVMTGLSYGHLFAQSTSAEITGRIVDASGAVVPAVTVVVRNEETGVKRETAASDTGIYTCPCSTPDTTASPSRSKGSGRSHEPALSCKRTRSARVDFVMEVGLDRRRT